MTARETQGGFDRWWLRGRGVESQVVDRGVWADPRFVFDAPMAIVSLAEYALVSLPWPLLEADIMMFVRLERRPHVST